MILKRKELKLPRNQEDPYRIQNYDLSTGIAVPGEVTIFEVPLKFAVS